jgi:alginate O-acetyltransferase complex protein AlgI
MAFTSWPFAALTIVTLALYYLPPLRRFQIQTLLVASVYFYAYEEWRFLPLLLGTLFFTFYCVGNGRQLQAIGIIANLMVLAVFKYKFLFVGVQDELPSNVVGMLLALPLPIGISFFVFHNISMLVDFVQRKLPRPKFAEAGVYIIFFPQLISGPINKARDFFPQISPKRIGDVSFVSASRWIIGGYFLKLFCANNLDQLTSWMSPALYPSVASGDRAMLLMLYSFQIFADFAGYSAIAIGIALLFGYRLPINFREPYTSASFSEFWTRWHISLSSWLRTYLYIPLGGNRLGTARTHFNLMAVMTLGGLWHGAGLSYLFWGMAHGACLVLERPFLGYEERLYSHAPRALAATYRGIRIILVFIVVSFLWIFFKLPNFTDAMSYASTLGGTEFRFRTNFYWYALVYSAPVVLLHLFVWVSRRAVFQLIEPAFYAALLFLSIVEAGPDSAFIYFQF